MSNSDPRPPKLNGVRLKVGHKIRMTRSVVYDSSYANSKPKTTTKTVVEISDDGKRIYFKENKMPGFNFPRGFSFHHGPYGLEVWSGGGRVRPLRYELEEVLNPEL